MKLVKKERVREEEINKVFQEGVMEDGEVIQAPAPLWQKNNELNWKRW